MKTGVDMKMKAAGADEVFWNALLDHIVAKVRSVQKVQVKTLIRAMPLITKAARRLVIG